MSASKTLRMSADLIVGKAWALLGIAMRIALNQGLHRDPSLFPTGSMDALTIELRRRIWHQVGHLEFRAAECKGQEPSLSEDYYTTLFPRNVEDEELIDGASPGPAPYDEERFTSITFQLVRYQGMSALRRIIRSTYHLERRMLDSGLHGTSRPDPARELQELYEQRSLCKDSAWGWHPYSSGVAICSSGFACRERIVMLSSLTKSENREYSIEYCATSPAKSHRIFEKSVNCIETINGASVDVDAARFQWHIGSLLPSRS
jgi:hypothetical protein